MPQNNYGRGGNIYPTTLGATAPEKNNDMMSARNKQAFLATDRFTAPAQQNRGTNQINQINAVQHSNEVWVKKWVDYSSKYGLGYYLSNEATGVFFNDSTKIVLDPNGFHFDYMERRSADRQDVGKEYTL